MRCWSRKAPTWWPSIGSLAGITPHLSSGHCADRSGFISRCGARVRGEVIRDLGGGRLTKDSVINFDVGVDGIAKPGEEVKAGSTLARVHAVTTSQAEQAAARMVKAFEVSSTVVSPNTLIQQII